MEERLSEASKNVETLKKERDSLEIRLREADSKHSNATSALLQRIEQLQIQNDELTRVRSFDEQLRQQLAEREKQIEKLTAEKDDLVQRFVEKTKDSALPTEQVVEAKNKLSAQLSELQIVTQRLTIENNKLKERLMIETQPERITKLTTAIEILQREKEDLSTQVAQQVRLSSTFYPALVSLTSHSHLINEMHRIGQIDRAAQRSALRCCRCHQHRDCASRNHQGPP